ncbi:SufE family protein [uncultured Shewanella sp.]|uniref:SufE family protein n=1 Tax=uncultured Shewanella sp. TaxID=173975 RepID=UPI0026131238|nr:SufE family protein [uncultured Shewanella sp.]
MQNILTEAYVTPDLFTPLSFNTEQVLSRFTQARNWQERYRQLMLLGKQLPKLASEYHIPNAQVQGCESNAWLYHYEKKGTHFYTGDSDARIVRGLIVLLLIAYNDKTTTEINAFDHTHYFEELGLSGQLSPSRSNGLHALINAIKDFANTA